MATWKYKISVSQVSTLSNIFNNQREILYLRAAMYHTLCIFLFTGRWAYITIIVITRNLYHAVSMEIFSCTL